VKRVKGLQVAAAERNDEGMGNWAKPRGGSRRGCIILASGRSTRMGGPKALLVWGADTPLALAHTVARRSDCGTIVLVARPEVAKALRPLGHDCEIVPCVEPFELGPAGAIAAAVRSGALEGIEQVLLVPVDVPPPRSSTACALFQALGAGVLASRPRRQGLRGQPLACHNSVLDSFRNGVSVSALRDILEAFRTRCVDVDLDDPDVLLDLNTPEQFRARTGVWPAFWPLTSTADRD
jgi:molybdenum cofactor cytidylyltransferase